MIYVITSDIINAVKIGRWAGEMECLFNRYSTYYGHNLKILYKHCEDDLSTEREILKSVSHLALRKNCELHQKNGLGEIIASFTKILGNPIEYMRSPKMNRRCLAGFCKRHCRNVRKKIYAEIFLTELGFSDINDTKTVVNSDDHLRGLYEKYKGRYNEIMLMISKPDQRKDKTVVNFKNFMGLLKAVFSRHPDSKTKFKPLRVEGWKKKVYYGFV
jgi:hypothetical protein